MPQPEPSQQRVLASSLRHSTPVEKLPPVFGSTRLSPKDNDKVKSLCIPAAKTGAMNTMRNRVKFPLSEGIGVFIGVIAWDLLAEGRMDILKALLIAAPMTLVWFGVRCWKARSADEEN